jgi:steroid delta-isomerase-like uncharacterized protein
MRIGAFVSVSAALAVLGADLAVAQGTPPAAPCTTAAIAAVQAAGDAVTEVVWNQGRIDRLGEFYTPDVVRHVPERPEPIVGLEANQAYIRQMREAFPDGRVTTERAFSDGRMAAVSWVWTGTHTGDMPGLPATGKKVRLPGISLVRVRDGKFAEIWDQSDQLTFLVQLGVIHLPPPPAK